MLYSMSIESADRGIYAYHICELALSIPPVKCCWSQSSSIFQAKLALPLLVLISASIQSLIRDFAGRQVRGLVLVEVFQFLYRPISLLVHITRVKS